MLAVCAHWLVAVEGADGVVADAARDVDGLHVDGADAREGSLAVQVVQIALGAAVELAALGLQALAQVLVPALAGLAQAQTRELFFAQVQVLALGPEV